MNPIFAKGKTNQRTVTNSLTAGTTQIDIASASTHFNAGDYLFISESDLSETEALGKILTITATEANVSNALLANKTNTAIVWKPTSLVDFDIGYLGMQTPIDRGIIRDKTVGGIPIINRIRSKSSQKVFSFAGVERSIIESDWESFLETTLEGYKPFTFVDTLANVNTVKYGQSAESQVDFRQLLITITYVLEIITEGLYT